MIGKGATTTVYKLSLPGYEGICVKFFGQLPDPTKFALACKEANNLLILRRDPAVPGVPNVIGVCHYPPGVIMSMHDSTTLLKLLVSPALSEYLLVELMRQIVSILMKIHSRGYLHNNIKASNISVDMTDLNDVKVVFLAFGSMTPIPRKVTTDYNSSPTESRVMEDGGNRALTEESELPSVKSEIYYLCVLLNKIRRRIIRPSPELQAVFNQGLDDDPNRRPELHEIMRTIINHQDSLTTIQT